jgi:formylmethanofuran dehydrogenase subunit E
MDELATFVECGTLTHGHACPPLVLGIRAGFVAMTRLGVGRALDRELFAFVELGSDHYAQGFADGIQVATGCTFGKDLIVRIPYGKASVRLVDQARGCAVRVVPHLDTIAKIERSDWFRVCSSSGKFAGDCATVAGTVIEELLQASDEALFTVSPVFPLGIENPSRTFETVECDACGESVLASYARERDGRRLCVACDERRRIASYRVVRAPPRDR